MKWNEILKDFKINKQKKKKDPSKVQFIKTQSILKCMNFKFFNYCDFVNNTKCYGIY